MRQIKNLVTYRVWKDKHKTCKHNQISPILKLPHKIIIHSPPFYLFEIDKEKNKSHKAIRGVTVNRAIKLFLNFSYRIAKIDVTKITPWIYTKITKSWIWNEWVWTNSIGKSTQSYHIFTMHKCTPNKWTSKIVLWCKIVEFKWHHLNHIQKSKYKWFSHQ